MHQAKITLLQLYSNQNSCNEPKSSALPSHAGYLAVDLLEGAREIAEMHLGGKDKFHQTCAMPWTKARQSRIAIYKCKSPINYSFATRIPFLFKLCMRNQTRLKGLDFGSQIPQLIESLNLSQAYTRNPNLDPRFASKTHIRCITNKGFQGFVRKKHVKILWKVASDPIHSIHYQRTWLIRMAAFSSSLLQPSGLAKELRMFKADHLLLHQFTAIWRYKHPSSIPLQKNII